MTSRDPTGAAGGRHRRAGLVAFASGALATALVVWLLTTTAADRDRQAFEAATTQATDAIGDRVETSVALLRGTAGLFASQQAGVTVDSFGAYVGRLALRTQYPGLLGIGYSRRVPAAERESVEAEMRLQGRPDFRIWPASPREEYHAIVYIEPLDERNRAAVGFDMFTNDIRREAMSRARDEGEARASGIVELVQEIDHDKQPGFLIYLPVYRGGSRPATVEARRDALMGFAYAPIRAVDFLSTAFAHEDAPGVGVSVYQGDAPVERALLYERRTPEEGGRFTRSRTVTMLGQPWTFVYRSRESPVHPFVMPVLVLATGLALSLLLAVLVGRERLSRDRLQVALERERAARAESERAHVMKDEFLATLSHELRTPLNAILGWTALLSQPALPEPQRRKGLEVVDRNARAQARLIEDLLDMNRIVSGKLRLEMQDVDLGGVVADARRSLAPAAHAKQVALRASLPAVPVHVRGDPARLLQVVWNLLSNAIKFTPAGGEVTVGLEAEGGRARVAVTDSGEGIEPAHLERIFDRFAQADASTTRRHGGLGLGLAIVRQLVELHQGEVRARSEGLGRGATFTVELPTVAAPAREAAAQSRDATGTLAGVRVLAVDDDGDARELMRLVLSERGADVRTAASAPEALDAIRTMRPDVLLSDIGMPGMDGYQLLRAVRELPVGRDLRAAAITAFARESDRDEAIHAGFEAHLVKPISPEALVSVVSSLARAAR